MNISNVEIMGVESSIIASGYPMRTKLNEELSDKSIARASKLCSASKVNRAHEQFLTGIRVNFDLTCSNKMWVEAERYRFLEFVSSQSTMHRISKFDIKGQCNNYVDSRLIEILQEKVDKYNYWLNIKLDDDWFKNNKFGIENNQKYQEHLDNLYLEVLYNTPSGLELTARMTTNYRCLKNIYLQRKNHRLPEWRQLCKWIETLPYFNEFLDYEK